MLASSACARLAHPQMGAIGTVLDHAQTMELYRVHESYADKLPDGGVDPKLAFLHDETIEKHGPAAGETANVAAALEKAVAPPGSPMAKCFSPGHAVRVSDGVRTLDFVICFSCKQMYVYEGDTRIENFPVQGDETALDAAFQRSGV